MKQRISHSLIHFLSNIRFFVDLEINGGEMKPKTNQNNKQELEVE